MLDEDYPRAERLVGPILWQEMAHSKLKWHHFLASNLEDLDSDLSVVNLMQLGISREGMHTEISFIDFSAQWQGYLVKLKSSLARI